MADLTTLRSNVKLVNKFATTLLADCSDANSQVC